MSLIYFVSCASRPEEGLAVVWNQCFVSAHMCLRGEWCGSHNEVLCVPIAALHSQHSAGKDVCICVRQAHTFIYIQIYTYILHITQIITKQTSDYFSLTKST